MATSKTPSKKPAAKKATTAKRAAPAKKTTAKKVPAKRASTKKTPAKAQSFTLQPETQPFISFKITEQTVYWLIFTLAVLFFGLWILSINIQVQELYDQIDRNNISQVELDAQYNRLTAQKSR